MEGQSHDFVVGDSADFRSFAVEAWAGRRASGWPFSRFDISSRELRVRLSFPWFTTRSQQAAAIQAVQVTRRLGDMCCTSTTPVATSATCTSTRYTVVSR